MSEVVNVVVALAVIVFVVRWATTSRETPEERNVHRALGFRPKTVTPDMLETISSMFPDMPKVNIHYDLLRTGDVEMTTNKIIERGFLDPPPPAYFRIYPRPDGQQRQQAFASQPGAGGSDTSSQPSQFSSSITKGGPSLISRYHLEERLSASNGSGMGGEGGGGGVVIDSPEQAGGKAAWEATPERREASLRERKAQMILAARKRLLGQQKAAGARAGASSSGSVK